MKKYKKIDALFVNPPSPDKFIYIRDINRHGRSSWERMIWPQTNLAILAAVLEKQGLTVDVVDCIADNISWDDYVKILEVCQPKYCFSNLISVTFHNDVTALILAKRISNAITVGMGPHITANPVVEMKKVEGIDFAVCNEAENTLSELISYLETNSENIKNINDLIKIKGLCFKPSDLNEEEKNNFDYVVVTEKREFIKNLDDLPIAKHDLLPVKKYWAPILNNYVFIETSRGCPYKCIFCRQGVMYEWKYRIRSAKSLFDEVMLLHKLGVDRIMFHADTFTVNQKIVLELCDRLIEAGSPVKWACNGHAKTLIDRPEMLQKMKQAGCWMIAVGIESGDDKVLENARKSTNVEMITKAVNLIHSNKMEVWGYFIIGLPGETKNTIQKTIDLSLKLPLSIAKFDIGAPYPGTEFYDIVKRDKLIDVEIPEDFDQNASAVVNYKDLSAKEIKSFTRKATLKFYLRPKIIFYMIKKMTNLKTIISMFLILRDMFLLQSNKSRSHDRKNAIIKKFDINFDAFYKK